MSHLTTARLALAAYYRHGMTNDAVDEEHDARALLEALGVNPDGPEHAALADGAELRNMTARQLGIAATYPDLRAVPTGDEP